MFYLICSDIHGSKVAANLVATLDLKYNFKKIVLLGDINYSGARNIPPVDYSPIDVCAALKPLKKKLVIIRGNCDSRVDEMVLDVKFVDKAKIKLGHHNAYLTHGDLYNSDDFHLLPGDFYFYGHTHIYVTNEIDGFYIMNPGSMSLPKVYEEKTYMIYDSGKEIVNLCNLEGKIIKTLYIK
jgi:uncharacterized protein